MRCWENVHRTVQAEVHIHTVLFREETRFPGYYMRADLPKINPEWLCFCNATRNPKTGEYTMRKVPIIDLEM